MKCLNVTLQGNGPWILGVTGDWHMGNPGCHYAGIKRCIKRMSKLTAWLHLADAAESIIPGDKRFSIEEHGKVTPIGMWQKFCEAVEPAKENCIGILSGNHESNLSKLIGNLSRFLAGYSGIPYLTQTAMLTLKSRTGQTTWGALHGHLAFTGRGIDDEREALNREKRLRRYVYSVLEADIITVGHGHRTVIAPPVFKNKMIQHGVEALRRPVQTVQGWACMAPAMLKVYGEAETYAEANLYQAACLGWLEFRVDKDGSIPYVRHIDEDGKSVDEITPRVLA